MCTREGEKIGGVLFSFVVRVGGPRPLILIYWVAWRFRVSYVRVCLRVFKHANSFIHLSIFLDKVDGYRKFILEMEMKVLIEYLV
jgi:hypothetical protein